MSRIGRMPVAIPAGVTVEIAEGNKVTVKGSKGTLERVLPAEMEIKMEDGQIIVTRPNDLKKMKSLHGLTRTLIHNMVVGVSEGYTKTLEVNGVGYKAAKQGKKLVLSLGYSHPVEMEDPEGLESTVEGNKIVVKGISKEKVGQYAAEIRDKRRPEPVSYTHLVQVGFVDKREKLVNKPMKGQFDKAGVSYKRFVREFKLDDAEGYAVAQEIKADVFQAGDKIDATAVSKGKGFQGAIKRHGQSRGCLLYTSRCV